MKSDIAIAREIELQRIEQIAESIGLPPRTNRTLWPPYSQSAAELYRRREGKEEQSYLGYSHYAQQGRRGKNHSLDQSRSRSQSDRQEGYRSSARAIARPMLRHEGRSCRRRICSGIADGKHQPPLHGRLPCSHLRTQYDYGTLGELHLSES